MLPFLRKQQEASVSLPVSTLQRSSESSPSKEESYDLLEYVAQNLIQAMQEGNCKAVSESLRAAFEICQSESDSFPHPHE